MTRYPEGYLLAERLFTSDEEAMFWKHSDMVWKDNHCQAVLDKREQFKVLWNKVNLPERGYQ